MLYNYIYFIGEIERYNKIRRECHLKLKSTVDFFLHIGNF